MKHILFFILTFVLLTIISCRKNVENDLAGTYRGPEKVMGNGKVKSWVSIDAEGKPISLGITMTSGALENLPDTTGHNNGNHPANIFELELPKTAFRTPFSHLVMNWNPMGHFPPPYAFQHFDVHFYIMPSAERMLIPEYKKDSLKFKKGPDAAYLPTGYFYPGGGEPEMGAHWVDMNAPELKPGGIFTETFIYGSYDGKVTFLEPMLTYLFLKNVTDYSRSIPKPAKVQVSGYYPNTLRIYKSDGNILISLKNFEYREAQ